MLYTLSFISPRRLRFCYCHLRHATPPASRFFMPWRGCAKEMCFSILRDEVATPSAAFRFTRYYLILYFSSSSASAATPFSCSIFFADMAMASLYGGHYASVFL